MSFKIIENDHQARIKVVGIGGAGGNAINRMIEDGMNSQPYPSTNKFFNF